MLAKAVCGLTNADGGVLVLGMKAESRPKDEADVVTAEAPVPDTSLVKSRVLGLISNLIEPPVAGLEVLEIADAPNSRSGFVVIYVPASDGSPARSRKDWKFYQRIGSASLPMEYRQIEERFGVRPHARLRLTCSDLEIRNHPIAFGMMQRVVRLTLSNEGRGLARFPAVRCSANSGFHYVYSMMPADQPKWQSVHTSDGWISFRGGANDVIYPSEVMTVAMLTQGGQRNGLIWAFPEASLCIEALCEGMPTHSQTFQVPADSYNVAGTG